MSERKALEGIELEMELMDMDWEDVEAGADYFDRLLEARQELGRKPQKDVTILEVRQKRCSNCLFSKARLVSEASADDHIIGAMSEGTYFQCHESDFLDRDICCRGYFDEIGDDSLVILLGRQLDLIRFVNVEKRGDDYIVTESKEQTNAEESRPTD